MKRLNNIKQNWCTYENLYAAFLEVKKRKSYHHNFLMYESNLAVNLSDLLGRLEGDIYQTRPYRAFYVYDPKERLIEAPYLEDRIVQHALLRATRDIIERRFVRETFACIKGRGTHKASEYLQRMLRQFRNTGYYLKIDIRKFFYTIPHDLVLTLLKQIIKCKDTIKLYELFLRDNNQSTGLPLGSVTSQVLANLALNPLDHFIKRTLKMKHYARYMDDMIILHEDKGILRSALQRIKTVVTGLGLELNAKTKISQIAEGIDFVGFRTYWNRKVIRKRTLFKIKRICKKGINAQQISSFLAHAKRTHSLKYVYDLIIKGAGELQEFTNRWIKNNRKDFCYGISIY